MRPFSEIFRLSPSVGEKEPPRAPRKMEDEIAWSESRLYVGVLPKYNPDELIGRRGHDIYRKMMRDEQVKAVVKFKRDAITSRDYYFEFPDDTSLSDSEMDRRIRMFGDMLEHTSGSFLDHLNYVMRAMWQGFSLSEKVYDTFEFEDRPYLGLKKLSPKPYETFHFVVDEFGNVKKLEQDLEGRRQVIPLEKFVYFVCNPEMDQHYGQSDLREAYRSWYSKDVTIRLQMEFVERVAGGLIVARPKEGTALQYNSRDYSVLKELVSTLRSMSSVLLPSNIELTVESPKSTDVFERTATFHDLQIAKALLVPNLLGISHAGQTGSYSQADIHLEAFLWTLDADASRLEDCVNEQMFQELGQLNFADGVCPKFRFKPVSDRRRDEMIAKWNELVQAGSVEASDTDEAHLRELLDFPEKGEPIKEPMPTMLPGQDPRQPPPGDEEEEEPGEETITGEARARVSAIAMSRATRRVHFQVIDRRSREAEEEASLRVQESLAAMLAPVIARIKEEKIGTPAGPPIETLNFRKGDMTTVRKEIDRSLQRAWTLGVRHATDEMTAARGETFRAEMRRIDEDAAQFIKTNGFRMLGGLSDAMRAIVQNVLINALKFSWTTEESTRRIYDSLTKAGLMSTEINATATGRAIDDVLEALEESTGGMHRIRTAVRTNSFQAINEARYSTFTDPELGGFVEALEYSAILDSRTTEICSSLDGRIYPVGSEEWNRVRPPNHYNCRSILVPVTIVDTDVEGRDRESGSRWSRPSGKEPQQGFGGGTG